MVDKGFKDRNSRLIRRTGRRHTTPRLRAASRVPRTSGNVRVSLKKFSHTRNSQRCDKWDSPFVDTCMRGSVLVQFVSTYDHGGGESVVAIRDVPLCARENEGTAGPKNGCDSQRGVEFFLIFLRSWCTQSARSFRRVRLKEIEIVTDFRDMTWEKLGVERNVLQHAREFYFDGFSS